MTPGFTPGLTPTNFASDFGKGQREGGLTMDPNNGAFFWTLYTRRWLCNIRVAANADVALLFIILTLSYFGTTVYLQQCLHSSIPPAAKVYSPPRAA